MSSIPKNLQNFPSARALAHRTCGKLFFPKNHRDLKNIHYKIKFVNIFLLIQRTIAKKKIWVTNIYFIFIYAKMGKPVFDLRKGKSKKKYFSSLLVFKQAKEQI